MKKNLPFVVIKQIKITTLLLFFISSFFTFNANAQCSITADFTYSSLIADIMPWEVDFTNTSTGTIDSYSWEVDSNEESTSEDFSFHFPQAKLYEVCLTVTRAACTDEKCVNITIEYNCAETCYQPVNGDFEYVVDPSVPGTLPSSVNFDLDMCSWEQERITPYYCYYPEDTYIAVRVDNQETEVAQSTIALDLVDGDQYYVCFDYSVQRLTFGTNPSPNDGPEKILVQLIEIGNPNELVIASVSSPAVDFPSSEGASDFLTHIEHHPELRVRID